MGANEEVPMQFLRTLFWVILLFAAALFAYRNWTPVEVQLFGGLVADAKLPVLMFGAFLLGLLPTYILHRTTRWQLRRRAEAAERSLAELRGADAAVALAPSPPAPTVTP